MPLGLGVNIETAEPGVIKVGCDRDAGSQVILVLDPPGDFQFLPPVPPDE